MNKPLSLALFGIACAGLGAAPPNGHELAPFTTAMLAGNTVWLLVAGAVAAVVRIVSVRLQPNLNLIIPC